MSTQLEKAIGDVESRVAHWECPYCGDTAEEIDSIRSHINASADDKHEGRSGWNPSHWIPGYGESGNVIATLRKVRNSNEESQPVLLSGLTQEDAADLEEQLTNQPLAVDKDEAAMNAEHRENTDETTPAAEQTEGAESAPTSDRAVTGLDARPMQASPYDDSIMIRGDEDTAEPPGETTSTTEPDSEEPEPSDSETTAPEVAYWECPHCDHTADSEASIRSHITAKQGPDHAEKSGWNPSQPIYGFNDAGDKVAVLTEGEPGDTGQDSVRVTIDEYEAGDFDTGTEPESEPETVPEPGEKKKRLINAWLAAKEVEAEYDIDEIHYKRLSEEDLADTSRQYSYRITSELENGEIDEATVEAASDEELQADYYNRLLTEVITYRETEAEEAESSTTQTDLEEAADAEPSTETESAEEPADSEPAEEPAAEPSTAEQPAGDEAATTASERAAAEAAPEVEGAGIQEDVSEHVDDVTIPADAVLSVRDRMAEYQREGAAEKEMSSEDAARRGETKEYVAGRAVALLDDLLEAVADEDNTDTDSPGVEWQESP